MVDLLIGMLRFWAASFDGTVRLMLNRLVEEALEGIAVAVGEVMAGAADGIGTALVVIFVVLPVVGLAVLVFAGWRAFDVIEKRRRRARTP